MNLKDRINKIEFKSQKYKAFLLALADCEADFNTRGKGRVMQGIATAVCQDVYVGDRVAVSQLFGKPEQVKNGEAREVIDTRLGSGKKAEINTPKPCIDCLPEDDEPKDEQKGLSASQSPEEVYDFFFAAHRNDKKAVAEMKEFLKSQDIKVSNNAGEKALSEKIFDLIKGE